MALPKQYDWLAMESAPKLILEAVNFYGLQEVAGPDNNPIIMEWIQEILRDARIDLHTLFTGDATPWCALFMTLICKRAGKPLPSSPLWARSYLNWGNPADVPMLGDILVFERGAGSGHVGLYVAEDQNTFHVLGGNQNDRVCIERILKTRLLGARRSYKVQPENARRIFVNSNGTISDNEA